MELLENLEQATTWSRSVMSSVTPDRYADTTPCAEWDVQTLANHLVGGTWMFAGAVNGSPMPTDPPSDLVGDDAAAAYVEAVAALREASSDPTALERAVQLPIGTVPGQVALNLALLDTVVHGWDLARATGQEASVPDGLAEATLGFATAAIGDEVRGPGMPFGPRVEIDSDAPAIDRLVAFLGRQPDA